MLATATSSSTAPIHGPYRGNNPGAVLTNSQVEFPVAPQLRSPPPATPISLPDRTGRLWLFVGLFAGLAGAIAIVAVAVALWALTRP
jgi:hypothetical protein